MLIDDLKNDYLDYIKVFRSNGTYRFYLHHLNSIIKELHVKEINDITRKCLINYISKMQFKGLSNKTINYRILSLKTMIKYFKYNDHIIFTIPKLKEKDYRYENLTRLQIKIFVRYLKTSNIKINSKLVMSLFFETGIRLNELINIKISNIDFTNRLIYLDKTKNGHDRIVFYGDLTALFIKNINIKNTYLINMTSKGVYAIFERAKEKLGFEKFHPHMLRHTYATLLIENNANLEFVRVTMGHTNIRTTQRYIHFNPSVMRNIYDNNFKY